MDLIIKPTEKCNFKCTFCSSTKISDDANDILPLEQIYRFLERFPETRTIIVNGGDPLMMKPEYYEQLLAWLDEKDHNAHVSFTTNLWPFYKNPEKWKHIFNHPRMGVCTSFQYGPGRLKGDHTLFTEEDFFKCSDAMLEHCGYRPDFIAVITPENVDRAIDNVRLAKEMGVNCKLNYAMSSGPQVEHKGLIIGNLGKPFVLSDIYEIYLQIYDEGLTQYEYNTEQMIRRLKGYHTTCPQNRNCDNDIRTLQPSGDYYSCGSFGDDKEYPIDFEREMNGEFFTPLRHVPEIQTMKTSCFSCPMFDICNGCKKTVKDLKQAGLVEYHCKKMKTLAPRIIAANGLDLEVTEYVDESNTVN